MMARNATFRMSTDTNDNQNETNDHKIENNVELAMDFSIKHSLHNKWCLWYYENDRSQSWESNQKEVACFNTVEDFWSLYNNIKVASELRQGNDYSLFKYGIRPMWEDDANKRGGRWLISLDRKQRNSELDRYWLDILLCLIGEAFEHSEEICGAVVNIRGKGDKIGVWTSDASNSAAVLEIGRKLKERLNIPQRVTLGYQIHKDTMDKASSMTKHSYTV